MLCLGTTIRNTPCQFNGRYDGYCFHHRPRVVLNREHKCAFFDCLNQVGYEEYIFCYFHIQYEHTNRCYHINGSRCKNMTINTYSYCNQHDILLSNLDLFLDDMIIDNMSWGYNQRYDYDHDIIPLNQPLYSQLQIQSKPTKIILENKIEDICSICLEDFDLQTEIYKLKCKHFYHINCLDKWLEHKDTCPLDRLKIE